MTRTGSLFWWFIPDAALPLVVMGVGLALMVGILSGKRAFGILGMLALIILAEPFVGALLDLMPLWLLIPLMGVMVLGLLRTILGRRIFDEVVGHLLARLIWTAMVYAWRGMVSLVRLAFRALAWPVRGVRWLFRGMGEGPRRYAVQPAPQRAVPAQVVRRPPRPQAPQRPMPPGHFPRGYWNDR